MAHIGGIESIVSHHKIAVVGDILRFTVFVFGKKGHIALIEEHHVQVEHFSPFHERADFAVASAHIGRRVRFYQFGVTYNKTSDAFLYHDIEPVIRIAVDVASCIASRFRLRHDPIGHKGRKPCSSSVRTHKALCKRIEIDKEIVFVHRRGIHRKGSAAVGNCASESFGESAA